MLILDPPRTQSFLIFQILSNQLPHLTCGVVDDVLGIVKSVLIGEIALEQFEEVF